MRMASDLLAVLVTQLVKLVRLRGQKGREIGVQTRRERPAEDNRRWGRLVDGAPRRLPARRRLTTTDGRTSERIGFCGVAAVSACSQPWRVRCATRPSPKRLSCSGNACVSASMSLFLSTVPSSGSKF